MTINRGVSSGVASHIMCRRSWPCGICKIDGGTAQRLNRLDHRSHFRIQRVIGSIIGLGASPDYFVTSTLIPYPTAGLWTESTTDSLLLCINLQLRCS